MNVMQNMYSERFLKDSVKPLRSPFSVILQTFFYSKRIQRALVHSKSTQGTQALEGLGTQRALGHYVLGQLSCQGFCPLGHLRHSTHSI